MDEVTYPTFQSRYGVGSTQAVGDPTLAAAQTDTPSQMITKPDLPLSNPWQALDTSTHQEPPQTASEYVYEGK